MQPLRSSQALAPRPVGTSWRHIALASAFTSGAAAAAFAELFVTSPRRTDVERPPRPRPPRPWPRPRPPPRPLARPRGPPRAQPLRESQFEAADALRRHIRLDCPGLPPVGAPASCRSTASATGILDQATARLRRSIQSLKLPRKTA